MYKKKLTRKITYNLKNDERLKRIPIMARRKNVVMRESNDNMDHTKMVIT